MTIFEKFDSTEIRLAPALEIKLDAARIESGEISGYVSTFEGLPDSYGDVVRPGAFTKSLAQHAASGTAPPLLWSHQVHLPIGRIEELREDNHGLVMRGLLNLKSSNGREAYEHLKHRDVGGFSFGFRVRERKGATLTDIELVEVSVVALPANPRARVISVKSDRTKRDLKELLREGGWPKRAADKIADGGWARLSGNEDTEQKITAALSASTNLWKGR